MKKLYIALGIIIVVFFFPKPFISSPGFVTPEGMAEFNASKKVCTGFAVLTNAPDVAADAQGKSVCFGWLH